jgi:FMN phosphatase YigB (HAD superfamily)
MSSTVLGSDVRAVLFDVDGTLYDQTLLRAAMVAELSTIGCLPRGPLSPSRLWRLLSAFRRIREELRDVNPGSVDLESEQYRRAAEAAGVSEAQARAAVDEWIFTRPLKYLPLSRRRGVVATFRALRDRGLQVGVFSDYPAAAKLAALDLSSFVTLEVCATDAAVNAFKPHARGFLHACAIWGLPPERVIYVGDRPEVDAVGAAGAGMRCLIVGGGGIHDDQRCERVSFAGLMAALERLPAPTTLRAGEELDGIRAQ